MECGDPRGKSKRSDTHPQALALNSVGYHFVQRIDLCLSWLPAGKSGSAHGSQRWRWVYIRRTLGIPAPDCKNIEKRWVAGAGGTCMHRASLLQGEACLYFSPGICPRYLGQLPLPIPRKKLRLRPLPLPASTLVQQDIFGTPPTALKASSILLPVAALYCTADRIWGRIQVGPQLSGGGEKPQRAGSLQVCGGVVACLRQTRKVSEAQRQGDPSLIQGSSCCPG